jgi:hypothetical protein
MERQNVGSILWIDDEPDSIEETIERLVKYCGFAIKLCTTPQDAKEYIKSGLSDDGVPFNVGILDLKLGEEGSVAFDLAKWINSYFTKKLSTYPRLGVVTAFMEQYQYELLKLKTNRPLFFEYQKYELKNGRFEEFASDIQRSAESFLIDLEAVRYMRTNPPKVDRGYKLLEALFGYVSKMSDYESRITLWDPKRPNSRCERIFETSWLKRRQITRVGQPVRICAFEKEDHDIVVRTEPLTLEPARDWITLRPTLDYRRFRT